MIPRIASVQMGVRETVATVRWHDESHSGDGFPPIIAETEHRWPGRLHHREVAFHVAQLDPEVLL